MSTSTCVLKVWRGAESPRPAYEYRIVALPGIAEMDASEAQSLLDRFWVETQEPARMALQTPTGIYERSRLAPNALRDHPGAWRFNPLIAWRSRAA